MQAKAGHVFWAAVLAATGAGGVAIAQEEAPGPTDITTLTCRDLLLMDGSDEADALIFLHGYLSGQRGDEIVERGPFAVATDRVKADCIDAPERNLLEVFEENR